MKKVISIMVAIILVTGMFSIAVSADDTQQLSANINVTIASAGKIVVAQEKITVTDTNGDGTLTVDEALFAAHEAKYEGGAAAGYESYIDPNYGLSLKKLWGDTSGNFGYYVNNASAWSLADEVKEGDYLNAFVYADPGYSDVYCYFDKNTANAVQDGEITLTLSSSGFGPAPDFLPVTLPVENAEITLNGVSTGIKTDADGKATVKLNVSGNVVISAVSDEQILVPPVCIATVASNKTENVFVTLSDKDGKLVLAQEKIAVTDCDKDGYITVNDALYAAHEAKYEGGAEAGYGYYYSSYGLSLSKLWGDTSGSFGYYVNNKSAWSLADEVKEGDYVNAFVYTDLSTWSDTFCFFDKNTLNATEGQEVTLTLSAAAFDAQYNPITVAVKNAEITVNGEKSGYKTDENGKVTVKFDKSGTYVISAVSSEQVLVPPVLIATVTQKTAESENSSTETEVTDEIPPTGENNSIIVYTVILAAAVMGVTACTAVIKRKTNEK